MSKIVKAINVMVSNPAKITHVTEGTHSDELFFMYMDKHKWSMTRDSGGERYFLHFYPGNTPIEELASYDGPWEEIAMVTYASSDLGGREAAASMRELYTILREKQHGVDDILDEIIADDIPF